jgi:hypothetical protein
MAIGDAQSCMLVEDNIVPEFFTCTIKTQPATGFKTSLNLKRASPCFYLTMYDLCDWEDSSGAGEIFPIDFVNGVPTRSTTSQPSWLCDRAKLHVELEMYETLAAPSFRKTYEISISLRRVSSTAGVLNIRRFVLAVEYRVLSSYSQQRERMGTPDGEEL